MKNLILATLGLFISLAFSSCERELFTNCLKPKGDSVTQIVDLDEDISGFDLGISADVILEYGEEQEIRIEAAPNIIEVIEEDSDVSGGIWNIEIDGCSNIEDVMIYITLEEFDEIRLSGSGNIESRNELKVSDNLDLTLDGSGDIEIEYESNSSLEINLDGSGDIEVTMDSTEATSIELDGSGNISVDGYTDLQEIELDGSGDIKNYGLNSDKCVVDINGSGDSQLTVISDLTVKIDGSGDVCYKGEPTVTVSIDGTGDVTDCN